MHKTYAKFLFFEYLLNIIKNSIILYCCKYKRKLIYLHGFKLFYKPFNNLTVSYTGSIVAPN